MGFIPGAYVFPGGRVDSSDADEDPLSRFHGISPELARRALGPDEGPVPAMAYWVAALRETFEETGLLLRREHGPADCMGRPRVSKHDRERWREARARSRLLAGEWTFTQVLDSLEVTLDAGALRYVAHWITPEVEPRRYDTRFFAAQLQGDCEIRPQEGEVSEAFWITPALALSRNRGGRLPLVFPTLRTLEELEAFSDASSALEGMSRRPIPRHLPWLTKVDGGIGIILDP